MRPNPPDSRRPGGVKGQRSAMEYANDTRLCALCLEFLGDGEAGFCPSCGAAVIDHSLLHAKSTAKYDPTSKEWKPWKDKPLIPKRNYKLRTDKPKPWYPAMKVEARKVAKQKVDVVTGPAPTQEGEVTTEACSDGPDPQAVAISHEDGKSRSGVAESVIYVPDQLDQTDPPSSNLREVSYPLAAYDLEVDSRRLVMIVTLVEHLYGPAGSPRVYWLKISAIEAADDDTVSGPDTEPDAMGTLDGEQAGPAPAPGFPTAFLSNAACLLLYPYEDWTDLDKIDADQFYVTQYLQEALRFLPFRVATCLTHGDLSILTPSAAGDVEDQVVVVYKASVHVEQRQTTWTALTYGQSHDSLGTAKIVMSHRKSALRVSQCRRSLVVDDCLLEHRGALKVARSVTARQLPVKVRSFVRFADMCSEETCGTSSGVTKDQLRQSVRATHLHLVVAPCEDQRVFAAGGDYPLPILHISFDGKALRALLSTDAEEALQESGGDQDLWRLFVDRVLLLLRVELTAEQSVAFSLVGSFSDPVLTSQPWPEGVLVDTEGDDEEDEA